ncbi:MAG: DUF222 domain-containing protein [Gordonia sp. (in: high G+C Gram-positive bacteria)]|uniref:DUF222 domain-containing protein n=1 Tax=Gordonia sp. (in: high G+C Gram-positive bacteria) TaxID=84139 RepID=UPI003BB697D7
MTTAKEVNDMTTHHTPNHQIDADQREASQDGSGQDGGGQDGSGQAGSGPVAPGWREVDFTPAGMVAPARGAGDRAECRGWLAYARAAHRGRGYLQWAQLTGISEFIDIALADLHDAVCAGQDQRDVFDPYTLAVTEVAIVFAIPNAAATRLVGEAVAMSERLPQTAVLLRDGTISADMFSAVVARTDVVDERALIDAVDTDLAARLAAAGHISQKRVEKIADRIVDRHDRDAVRRKAEKARRRKNVSQRDYPDGLGGLNITASAEETVLALQAVNAAVAGCCGNDPRTLGQRRSDYAIAQLRQLPFTCDCPDTTTCTATLTTEAISQRQARIIVHAVCQKSTLTGADDHPAYLDGAGPISAEHLRDIAARPDAIVRDLDLGTFTTPATDTTATPDTDDEAVGPMLIVHTSRPADPYRPTAALEALVRGLFGTCTVPGCERPAWSCELDHVEEYDHICPASGGPTCLCNISPKCVMHHQLKTFLGASATSAGWIDEQWIDDAGTVWTSTTTAHGITVDTPAANQWLFPQLAQLTCLHHTHAPPDTRAASDTYARPDWDRGHTAHCAGDGLRAATADKHAWRRAARQRLRTARNRAAKSDGPPPF